MPTFAKVPLGPFCNLLIISSVFGGPKELFSKISINAPYPKISSNMSQKALSALETFRLVFSKKYLRNSLFLSSENRSFAKVFEAWVFCADCQALAFFDIFC